VNRFGATIAFVLAGQSAHAQGVPVVDPRAIAEREAVIAQTDQDLALQEEQQTLAERLAEIEEEQLTALRDILEVSTIGSGNGATAMVEALEAGPSDEASAAALYPPEDGNPATGLLFGDARLNVEELIIAVAKETHSLPGVGRAGLSVVQWRCLLQALIWQESRFQIGARSPAGAFGLTQIMPATAGDLGIYPAYYESPQLQVTGGARYLAQMLNMFDGNIIHGLAAYNAGPGNVQDYGGVPPFEETQHYVQVIPAKYNEYLRAVGGVDALGTIDPALLANASFSFSAHGSGVYGDYSMISVRAAAARIAAIIERIDQTEDIHEALALNTYARAELVRLVAIRTRLKAVQTAPLSAEQIAIAALQAQERRFMTFDLEEIQ
jgi:hypothetical protein